MITVAFYAGYSSGHVVLRIFERLLVSQIIIIPKCKNGMTVGICEYQYEKNVWNETSTSVITTNGHLFIQKTNLTFVAAFPRKHLLLIPRQRQPQLSMCTFIYVQAIMLAP